MLPDERAFTRRLAHPSGDLHSLKTMQGAEGKLATKMIAAAAAGVLLLSFGLPCDMVGMRFCFFRMITGLPCPGCGLTRSIIALSHAQWLQAWRYHPFGFVAYPLLVVLTFAPLIPTRVLNACCGFLRSPTFGYPFTLALVGYAILRCALIWRGTVANIW